ncbi:MAG: ATP-binding protein [Thermoplasmata archaeon]
MPDDKKDKIFDKGYTTDKEGGTGLGLFLVKVMINSYDGNIQVKDSELGGARFDVNLFKV